MFLEYLLCLYTLELGKNLKKKLRAADLARATKKSPVAAKKWLDGTSVPTAENLKVIAKFLGVSDDWLLYGGSDEQESSNNLAQLNVIDIEAFKQKYNIPDSEDAVKFVQAPAKPFPIQKDMFQLKPIQKWEWMGISQIWDTMEMLGMAMFQLIQQVHEPMALKALATQCFQQFVMAGMLYATLMQILCRMSLFRCA